VTTLLLQIALWVFVAMLIGAVLGWMLRRLTTDEKVMDLETQNATLKRELEAARAALGQSQQERSGDRRLREKAEAELAALELSKQMGADPDQAKRIQALELELDSSKERVHVLEVEVQSARASRPPTPVTDPKQMATLRAFNLNLERELGEARARKNELATELEAIRLELADLRRHSDSPPQPKPQQLGLELVKEHESELQEELDKVRADLETARVRYRESQATLTEMIVRSGEAIAPEWILDAPDGPQDDLKRIRGIGPKLESVLNSVGIYQFAQLAKLDAPGAAWLSAKLGTFPGRIFRDQWIEQAQALSEE
jgi:predicted flap endonuclease-1-like 5' DNA nuclease